MMNKEAIMTNLLTRLEKVEYTHTYILGFTLGGSVYAYTGKLHTGIKLDTASRGGGYSLRFKPTAKDKKAMLFSGCCEMVCSEKYFNEVLESCKYNKGEVFEKLVTEKMGLVWYKDNIRLDKGADIETNGKAYSVKYQNATIVNEKTLANIEGGE